MILGILHVNPQSLKHLGSPHIIHLYGHISTDISYPGSLRQVLTTPFRVGSMHGNHNNWVGGFLSVRSGVGFFFLLKVCNITLRATLCFVGP